MADQDLEQHIEKSDGFHEHIREQVLRHDIAIHGEANRPETGLLMRTRFVEDRVTAIEKMQADKAVQAAVQAAAVAAPGVIELLEVGGGIAKAREASIIMQNAEKPFWFNPVFWITVGLFPMMYMITAAILFTVAGNDVNAPFWRQVGFDAQTRSGLINLIVGFVFGGIVGVWFGTSVGSMKKDDRAAAVAEAKVT